MNKSLSSRRGSQLAFTLIELLVVVAIIAILASMLLPVLSRAKDASKSTTCLNNIRQITLSSFIYAEDNRSRMPTFLDWLFVKQGDLTSGKLFPYLKSKDVYLCPVDKAELTSRRKPKAVPGAGTGFAGGFGGKIAPRDYSYAMNCGLCHNSDVATFYTPGRTALYLEANMATNDYSGQAGPNMGNHVLAYRHRLKGHVAMGDMSVQSYNQGGFAQVANKKRFWFPNDDPTGMGGFNFGAGLQ